MAKFHVNGRGETGTCAANEGKCPFGGDEHHYPTREAAHKAFELSMASSTFVAAQKRKMSRLSEPKAVLPNLKAWREKGGQLIDDYGRDSEAMAYGLTSEKFLDLEDIRNGVTLPRNEAEKQAFIAYMVQVEKKDYSGLGQIINSEVFSRLETDPKTEKWANQTKLIDALSELSKNESSTAWRVSTFSANMKRKGSRRDHAYDTLTVAVEKARLGVIRGDIQYSKENYMGGVPSAYRVRKPHSMKFGDGKIYKAADDSIIHSFYVGGLLGNKSQEKIYRKSGNDWVDESTGARIDSGTLERELNSELAKGRKTSRDTLYAANLS